VELPWSADSKKRSVSVIRPGQSGVQHGIVQSATNEESSVPTEPKRQTIETRNTQQRVAEQATLVQTGSWRSGLTHTRQSPGIKLAHTRNKTTSEAPEASKVDSPGETSARVLQWQHFESALSEISPSSTEDGTLPELKKVRFKIRRQLYGLTIQWAEQYGDGGSKRSPRKGFGKSFGFGNLSKDSQSRYGRVKAEE
jgi:hypothetical protein